tara:strand:- start:196 stop:348 length:153 start_codon:yes stop_codon:yes gene_type:complete
MWWLLPVDREELKELNELKELEDVAEVDVVVDVVVGEEFNGSTGYTRTND